jgi:Phage tail sheath C-terminal domain
MALTSPGVEVTIIDQSQYLPAAGGSVPFVMVATAANKANPAGVGIAQATTAANAGKLYQVTSQRDLVTLYGNPFFYQTADGTPIQGYELNEYGLLAAYSVLGVTNNCYVLRADIDLASLVGRTGRPTANPADGTYWLDTTTTTWGIYVWSNEKQSFSYKAPVAVITDEEDTTSGAPNSSIGAIGDFAIVDYYAKEGNPVTEKATYYYKNYLNAWVELGSWDWLNSVPMVVGSTSNPTITIGDTITFTHDSTTYTVTATGTTLASLVGQINSTLAIQDIGASTTNNVLNIFGRALYDDDPTSETTKWTLGGTALASLGITAGDYYQAQMVFGTSAQQPLWQGSVPAAAGTTPAPTGSVWVKISTVTNGLNPKVSSFDATLATWRSRTCNVYTSDMAATNAVDTTGGKAIPAGSVYMQVDPYNEYDQSPVYIWKRNATGPTVVTGSVTNPEFVSGGTLLVQVSAPGETTLQKNPLTGLEWEVTIGAGANAAQFVTAWSAANISFTTAAVNSDGAIVLTHTEGGEIVIDQNTGTNYASNNILTEAGFIRASTDGCKWGPSVPIYDVAFATTNVSSSGNNLTVKLSTRYGYVTLDRNTFGNAGTGYAAGDIVKVAGTLIGGTSPANDVSIKITSVSGGVVTSVALAGSTPSVAPTMFTTMLSNWYFVDYEPNEGFPNVAPADKTNWFWAVADQADIMVRTQTADPDTGSYWKAYRNQAYDKNGFPKTTGTNTTDPNGPIMAASEPTTQSDGTTPLQYGDLWIDTGDLENFPVMYRWQAKRNSNGTYVSPEVGTWVLLDTSDQTSATGVLFADARWALNGTTNPANDPIPSIKSMLKSTASVNANYIDVDAPTSTLYPTGMLLFNTRRSGYNVKQYRTNYLTSTNFPDKSDYPTISATWVSASGLDDTGKAYMGRKAQRNMVVKAMRSTMDTNQAIRDEDNFFNLMATPNYPELQPNMVVLNNDRGQTGYILGDTPMGLPESATDIQAWATNAAGATSTGEAGCVTRDTYLGLFYPSGIAPDLSGNLVAVPASHMMLRTFIKNDTVAYPWLAAAGTRRGIIDNATGIGYLDRDTGEFVVTKTRLGIRNVLYTNFINPLVFFTGNGLLNYGNKTSFNSQSALDRTNVARLIAYVRRQLTIAARPFVFEPNDALTRQQIAGVVESLMIDLVAKRGIYDYLVVCDESNNTPARIDRNELWIDVALEPVKAAEFIYIPVRILNTGELSGA